MMYLKAVLKNKYRWSLWLGLLASFLLVACSQNDNSRTIETLKVAIVPHQTEVKLRRNYTPLIKHLTEHSGIPVELLIPASYEELLEWFIDKKIDMAMFGGVTYVKAHLKADAVPLVMRDVDARFKSVVLVQANNSANSLNDLKNSSFAFGSRLSTSGHLMPRHFFQQKNIIPETFFSKVQYTGAHDRTAEWVRDGKVKAGAVNGGIVNEMFIDGRLNKDKVKVIWQSPPFADYVWAIHSDVSKKQRTQIRDAFLHMNQDAEDIKILKNLGANYYVPANHEEYRSLEQVVLKMEQQEVRK